MKIMELRLNTQILRENILQRNIRNSGENGYFFTFLYLKKYNKIARLIERWFSRRFLIGFGGKIKVKFV